MRLAIRVGGAPSPLDVLVCPVVHSWVERDMGTYYEFVNTSKRQYLDIGGFGECAKSYVFTGRDGQSLHAMALAMLVCGPPFVTSMPGVVIGSWFGDAIYAAADGWEPDLYGIRTSTPKHPEQNLYSMAWREFQDITPSAVAMICDRDQTIAKVLVDRTYLARRNGMPCGLWEVLGRAVLQHKCYTLEDALDSRYDEHWKEAYADAEEYRLNMKAKYGDECGGNYDPV